MEAKEQPCWFFTGSVTGMVQWDFKAYRHILQMTFLAFQVCMFRIRCRLLESSLVLGSMF